MQFTQVYVQKSMRMTLPRNCSMVIGSVFSQPVGSTIDGAGESISEVTSAAAVGAVASGVGSTAWADDSTIGVRVKVTGTKSETSSAGPHAATMTAAMSGSMILSARERWKTDELCITSFIRVVPKVGSFRVVAVSRIVKFGRRYHGPARSRVRPLDQPTWDYLVWPSSPP